MALLGAVGLAACAAAPVAPPPAAPRPAWPEDWPIQFGLRCRSTGEDVRVCVCLASQIRERWTPEEFRGREPDALAAELKRCRELVAE